MPSGRLVRAALCFAATAGLASCDAPAGDRPAAPDSLHVRILATHDLHGALLPQVFPWSDGRPIGGVAELKAALDSAAARCACISFRFDGGDQMQGTLESNLTHGAAVVRSFNLLGLDAAAIGNHELDWGVDTFTERLAEADYAWLAANVHEKATGERPAWAAPYALVEREGVRIGVVGYLTGATATALRTSIAAPYEFRRDPAAIADALDSVRLARPDFIVIVAHAGGDCSQQCAGEMVDLARGLDSASVHLIVGGHAHTSATGVANGIPIVRAGADGRALSVVDLFRTSTGEHRFALARDTVFADRVAPDRTVANALRPYLALADSIAGRPLATLRDELLASERGLGRLIADAVRIAGRADVAIHNPGGVRANLPAGQATYGQVFRVLPFGNALNRLTLSGRVLRDVVEHGLSGGRDYFFSGITIQHSPDRAPSERTVSITLADGTPMRDDGLYTLATADFLAEGGDGFAMLAAITPEQIDMTVLDAMIEHLQSLPQPVTAPTDPRVIVERGPGPRIAPSVAGRDLATHQRRSG